MKNLKIIGMQIYNFDKLASDIPIGSKEFGTNSIIHRVFKHRVDEEDRRSEWRNVFSSKFHEHRRFPSTDRYFEKRSRRKAGCRLVDPPLFWIHIYIYKANITSLYQTCTIRSTVRCFNGRRPPIPLF